MAWRYRKSFMPLPGVHITVGSPGSGNAVQVSLVLPTPQVDPVTPTIPSELSPILAPIRSAGSASLTTGNLLEFKQLLEQAHHLREDLAQDLARTKRHEKDASYELASWDRSWLKRTVFRRRYRALKEEVEILRGTHRELEKQQQQARLQTKVDIPPLATAAYARLKEAFVRLTSSQCIWDTIGQRSTNQIADRTSASRQVQRVRVHFRAGTCDLIDSQWQVPRLDNANGGDLFLYPAFILFFASGERFSLLEYRDLTIVTSVSQFIEDEQVPSEAKRIGSTWLKTNKDGTPDRRFKDNREVPIVEYGKMNLTTSTGMNEEYMVSNLAALAAFVAAFEAMKLALAGEAVD